MNNSHENYVTVFYVTRLRHTENNDLPFLLKLDLSYRSLLCIVTARELFTFGVYFP